MLLLHRILSDVLQWPWGGHVCLHHLQSNALSGLWNTSMLSAERALYGFSPFLDNFPFYWALLSRERFPVIYSQLANEGWDVFWTCLNFWSAESCFDTVEAESWADSPLTVPFFSHWVCPRWQTRHQHVSLLRAQIHWPTNTSRPSGTAVALGWCFWPFLRLFLLPPVPVKETKRVNNIDK